MTEEMMTDGSDGRMDLVETAGVHPGDRVVLRTRPDRRPSDIDVMTVERRFEKATSSSGPEAWVSCFAGNEAPPEAMNPRRFTRPPPQKTPHAGRFPGTCAGRSQLLDGGDLMNRRGFLVSCGAVAAVVAAIGVAVAVESQVDFDEEFREMARESHRTPILASAINALSRRSCHEGKTFLLSSAIIQCDELLRIPRNAKQVWITDCVFHSETVIDIDVLHSTFEVDGPTTRWSIHGNRFEFESRKANRAG